MTPDRKKKLRVSSLFASSPLDSVVTVASEFSRDILFKNLIATSRRGSFVTSLFSANGTGVNAAPDIRKCALYYTNTLAASSVRYRQPSRTTSSPIYLIASSHAIIFSRVVRAAAQYRDNPLCAPFVRRFSREIFLATATSTSPLLSLILSSLSLPPRLSMFCFPAAGVRNFSKFISPFYLYFMVPPYARRSVSIVAQHPAEHPSTSPPSIHVSLHAPSRTFAAAVHKASRVYADYLLENLFAFAGPVGTLFFRKSTFLSSRCVNICYPPNSNRR